MSKYPTYLRFKTDRIAKEWNDPKLGEFLRRVVLDVAERRWTLLKVDTVVTSIYRTRQENQAVGAGSQTHPEWRAVDVRVAPEFLTEEMRIRLAINEKYPTGVRGMPRVPPLDHGTALHYHVQRARSEKEN